MGQRRQESDRVKVCLQELGGREGLVASHYLQTASEEATGVLQET